MMTEKKYVKIGSEDSFQGLFVGIRNEDFPEGVGEDASESEYKEFLEKINSEGAFLTPDGYYLSKKGKEVHDKELSEFLNQQKERQRNILDYYVKRIKEELRLNIIANDDIDIALTHHYRFNHQQKEYIKEKLKSA